MLYSPEDVTSARQTLGNWWPLLKPGLWHSTPAERYCAILNQGEINPDGGQRGNVYQGFVVSINAVSLFDFEKAKEDDALGTLNSKWSTHLKGTETRVLRRYKLDPSGASFPANKTSVRACRVRGARISKVGEHRPSPLPRPHLERNRRPRLAYV